MEKNTWLKVIVLSFVIGIVGGISGVELVRHFKCFIEKDLPGWLSAFGTIVAVCMSLYLARREEKTNIDANITVQIEHNSKMKNEDSVIYINIDGINKGKGAEKVNRIFICFSDSEIDPIDIGSNIDIMPSNPIYKQIISKLKYSQYDTGKREAVIMLYGISGLIFKKRIKVENIIK